MEATNVLFETNKRVFSKVVLPGELLLEPFEFKHGEKILSIQSGGHTEPTNIVDDINQVMQMTLSEKWRVRDKIGFYSVRPAL